MIGRSARTGVAVAALVARAVTSCSVDERPLQLASNSAGASGTSAGGSGMVEASAGEGGDASVSAPLPVCDYGSGVAVGCDTLVDNPGFAKNTDGWTPEEGAISMSWTDDDAAGNTQSGSLSVVNSLSGAADGIASQGAAECLPTSAGKKYGLAGDLFIPQGQGSGLDGGTYTASAALSVIFYMSGKCDSYTLGNATSGLLAEPGHWAHREGHAVAPDGANSMSVRLVTLKNFREFTFEARFDNVLLKEE